MAVLSFPQECPEVCLFDLRYSAMLRSADW